MGLLLTKWLTNMVYYNHPSLLFLVSDAQYIDFYPTFQLPPALSHCKYKSFTKSIEFFLFRYKYWLTLISVGYLGDCFEVGMVG